jgi:serine/threonine protein kinase
MWSVGCIFAELLLNEPLFQAKGELELISMIFKLLGPPNSSTWPDYNALPLARTITLPPPQTPAFRQKFPYITAAGIDLLSLLLTYDPERRITAEEALRHPYFSLVLNLRAVLILNLSRLLGSRPCQSIQTYLAPFPHWQQEKSECLNSLVISLILMQ